LLFFHNISLPELHLFLITLLSSWDLSSTGLTGDIPSEIGDLTNLTYLNLYNNQLTGEIPPEIGNLTNLHFLDLGYNELEGQIPEGISNLTNLETLHINWTHITGEIPNSIGNLTSIEIIHFNDNQLSGLIPDSICNLNLNFSIDSNFQVQGNNLCPLYPDCLTEGNIGYQDTSDCEEPSLCNEEIEVELWGECYNIEETTVVWRTDENLVGEIPYQIGDLINLEILDLRVNSLTSLPESIVNLSNLRWLNLSHNYFSYLPDYIGDIDSLQTFWVNHNNLTSIPNSICNLTNLLNNGSYLLGGNYICDESEIPECIQNHPGLGMGWTTNFFTEDVIETPQCCGDTGSEYCNCDYWWFDVTSNVCEEYLDVHVLGDVNSDGSLDVLDVVTGVQILLGNIEPTEYQLYVFDLNQDGTHNVLDIVLLVNYILSDG